MCCKSCKRRLFSYVLGMLMLGSGVVTLVHALRSSHWVGRVVSTDTQRYELRYGVWEACFAEDQCVAIWEHFPEVAKAARGAQFLMTTSVVFFAVCFFAEIFRLLPFAKKNPKCREFIESRMIEYVISVSAVVGFLGMLIFAGEVKNKAWRQIGQEDETGTGFQMAQAGLVDIVIGCCLVACGRDVKPAARNHTWS